MGDGQEQQCLCARVHVWNSTGNAELTANVYGQPWGAPAAYNLTAGHQVGLELSVWIPQIPKVNCSTDMHLPGRKPVVHEAGHYHVGDHGYPWHGKRHEAQATEDAEQWEAAHRDNQP